MAMTNRYAGKCCKCSAKVEAEAGYLQGPPWKTFCKACWVAPVPAVVVTVQGAEFVVTPKGFLEKEVFSAYVAATNAAQGRFDYQSRKKFVPVASASVLMDELKAAGFVVEIAPSVVAALQAFAAARKADLAHVSAHLTQVSDALAARGKALFPFQREGVEWLTFRDHALLADEMGLGKTAQALCSLPFDAPVLIVCPVVAKGVWKNEIKAWRPDFKKISVLSGRNSFRWPEPGEVVLINYDILSATELKSAPDGVVLIADEAHMLKNKKAKRTAAFVAVSKAVRAAKGKAWLLTATPLLNTPPELWQVLDCAGIAEAAFGSFGGFCKMFGRSSNGYGSTWGLPSDAVKSALAKVMLRRHRVDVLPDLPTKIRQEVEVTITGEAKKICDEVQQKLEKLGINFDEAVETTKFGGVAFELLSKARAALATSKIPSMLEMIQQYEEAGEPVVVFSAHRAPIDCLIGRKGWAVITGETSPEVRADIQQAFQSGELLGVAATIQAGGVAITLTKAHHALFVDLAWTPALNSQAEDRICRIGQDKGVIIKRLVSSHPIDQRVLELLSLKQELIEASVEAAAVKEVSPESIVAPTIEATIISAEEAISVVAQAEKRVAKAVADAEKVEELEPAVPEVRRGPKSDAEAWAANGLCQLALADSDFAREQNGRGFNKFDGTIGHSLAQQVGSGLTDKQWTLAIKIARKYRGQIGACPS